MLSRGVIVTAANYHSSPLKAESNGHITTPLPNLGPKLFQMKYHRMLEILVEYLESNSKLKRQAFSRQGIWPAIVSITVDKT